jgi:hypothetical protein
MRRLFLTSRGLESCVIEGGWKMCRGTGGERWKQTGDRPRCATGATARLPPSKDETIAIVKVGVLVAVGTLRATRRG